jgi:hypothetical protein
MPDWQAKACDDLVRKFISGHFSGFERANHWRGEPHFPQFFGGDSMLHPGEHCRHPGGFDENAADIKQDDAYGSIFHPLPTHN